VTIKIVIMSLKISWSDPLKYTLNV